MTTLIICIDRDNDIGEKAKISTPIIGRQANIQAAVTLGITDPEDSDTNCIFGALKLYERLVARGEDIEIVTVAGDIHVGVDSDRKIIEQVHQLSMKFKAKDAILVTDGAEDESLLNLIQTRIDVVGLERITVKQERKIEGIYYYIQRAIEDEKMRRVVLPIALILMAWGISLFFGLGGVMRGFIVFLVGAYLLIKTYHLEGELNNMFASVMEQIKEGKFSWVFSTISILIFIVGFFRSIDALRDHDYYDKHIGSGTSVVEVTFFIYVLIVLASLIWWGVLALLVREWGKFFDNIIIGGEKGYPSNKGWIHLTLSIFIIGTGLIFNSIINIVQYIAEPSDSTINISFQSTAGMFILGIVLLIFGRYLYQQNVQEMEEKKERHLLPMKRRKKISGWRH